MYAHSASSRDAPLLLVPSGLDESELIVTDGASKESRGACNMKIEGFSAHSITDDLSKSASCVMFLRSSKNNLTQ